MSYFPPTGSVVAFQSDPTKLLVHASVSGNMNASVAVMSVVPHSVAALQSTNPWNVIGTVSVVGNMNSSVAVVSTIPASVSGVGLFNVSHTGNGSIITVFSTPSIVGTYAEDTAHTTGERGIFTLGVRGDMVTSLVSANLDYSPIATDSFGRIVTKPHAPEEARVYGVSSTVNTNPSSLLAVAGTGLRNYITDIMIANTGSVSTLVTFRDGDASIIGKTIAPSGGGSNMIALATPMRTHAFNSQVEFTSGTATSILHVTAFGYKAP